MKSRGTQALRAVRLGLAFVVLLGFVSLNLIPSGFVSYGFPMTVYVRNALDGSTEVQLPGFVVNALVLAAVLVTIWVGLRPRKPAQPG